MKMNKTHNKPIPDQKGRPFLAFESLVFQKILPNPRQNRVRIGGQV